MCGIAGYIGRDTLPPERLDLCLERMGRRGPDARGVYHHPLAGGGGVWLLHTRLSIIDLADRSNQPFRDGPLVLAFNGELYNYVEVKGDLAARGETFVTDSDTEVLLRALRRGGIEALDGCEGMWAWALFDEDTEELWLSRDRFGEKPLFLHRDPSGLYFGSEVKFITALAGRSLTVNHRHLSRYLVNGYRSLFKTGETYYHDLTRLPPATVRRVAPDGAETTVRYWTPRPVPDEAMSYGEAVDRTRQALIGAVRPRLRADVPLAFCMSGGVDSNALISVAKNVFGYDVHGFTIVNSDWRYAENDMVQAAVAEQNLRHTAVPVNTAGFLDNLRRVVRYHDGPVATISYYAHWLLMQSIHDHGYKIAVSGTGADELFTGYYDHHAMYLAEVAADPVRFARALAEWRAHIGPIVRNPYLQDPEVFVKTPDERGHIFLEADRFAGFLRDDFFEDFAERLYGDDLLRHRMLNEMFEEVVPVILAEDDLNAMYFSIENRSPFLDRTLFETAFAIPTRHLIGDGYNKKVLRDAMTGIAPQAILDNRRKVGFNAPLFDFLDVGDDRVRAEVLDGGPIFEQVRQDRIEAMLDKPGLSNSESKFLFNFLCAKIFLEEVSAGGDR